MSNITSLSFDNLPIRTFIENSEIWFCGIDVCDILGYTNSRKALQDHCKPTGVTKRYTTYDKNEINSRARESQELTYINEPNLYRLIIKSRKPEAERFEAWVMEEVLPTIRKTGSYTKETQNTHISYTPKTHEVEDDVLHTLFNLLFLAEAQAEQLRTLEIALQGTALKLSPTAYSLHSETSFVLGLKSNGLKDLLTSLSKESDEWQKTLGHFNRLQVTAKNKQHRLAIR